MQQREDLAIVWLHLDGDRVTEARHCVVCQPHGPVIDVSCSCCGNGPLITGQPPELGAQLVESALDWMHSRGWQLHPPTAMPRRSQIAASIESRDAQDPAPILVTGRLHRPEGNDPALFPSPLPLSGLLGLPPISNVNFPGNSHDRIALMQSNATYRGRANILKRPNRLNVRSGSVAGPPASAR